MSAIQDFQNCEAVSVSKPKELKVILKENQEQY